MKRFFPLLPLLVLAAFFTAAGSAAPKSASLQIQHLQRGCHSWALNGGALRVTLAVKLARGGSLTVTNNDLMVQDLMKTSGPAVTMKLVRQSQMGATKMAMKMEGKPSPYAMSHMGAQVKVTFNKTGVYHFKLIDRGDYFDNIKTVGPDHHPILTVKVS